MVLSLPGIAGALTLDHEKATYSALSSESVTMTGHSELLLTGTGDPLPGCTIHLNSTDSWVFLTGVSPSSTVATLISRFRVNGATAVVDTNVRVVQYVNGSVVIPQPPTYQPLRVFTGRHLGGTSRNLGLYSDNFNVGLGSFADNIRSFVLKRGYTATFAANENGTGASANYVAQDSDLEISIMPAGLDRTVSFVRVFPWRWVSKKGSCDIDPVALNAGWHYNWNNSVNSTRNWEYVPIKQQPYWPGLGNPGSWRTQQVNHVLGFNEPNNSVEDAYKNLTPQGSVSDAVARMPELLATGMRLGAPAVTDGGYSWIVDFVNQSNAAGYRIDYVPVHYYRSYSNNANPAAATTNLYNFLKSIRDATGKPIWLTEFNNGANWTTDADPTFDQNKNVIEAMVNMMDGTTWIERYAIYSAVEEVRQIYYNAGGLTPMGTMYRDHVAPISHQQVVPDSGTSPDSIYLFEGGTRDILGGNNPLTYGTPKIVPGRNGTAISLDGSDDHLALPGKLGDSTDFSFAGWVKWNGGGDWQRIFDLGSGQANNMFLCPKTGSNLRFSIKYNNGTEQQLNAPALAPGVWTHVAVTISGDTGKLFVNGSPVATNNAMTFNPSQLATGTNYIGRSQYPDPLFNGLLDDLRFSSTALADQQVADLAASTPPQFVASPTVGAATVDLPFTGKLASQLLSSPDSVSFAKINGPSWITVSADGSLFGVPRLGDAGPNALLVQATAPGGAITTASLTIPVAVPESVARYAFNGNTVAATGTANGIPVGGATFAAGVKAQAIDLDGTDDHVTLPTGVASGDEITVATWVQWDGSSNWQRIFDFGNGTDSYLFLTPKSDANTLRFSIKNGAASQSVETTALTVGTWTHVAVTLGGGTAKIYVNGSLAATNVSPTVIKPSGILPATNYLGRSQYAADPYFNGRLDELHIFGRVLSATEIGVLRTGTAPTIPVSPRTMPVATVGSDYEASLIGTATVPSGTLAWTKAAGPGWLTVEPDGRISGVPDLSDSGTLPFRVRATSVGILTADVSLNLTVLPPAGLRSHLELDANTVDTTGPNPGTSSGSPAYAAGLFDQAMDLDGTDDFVQLPAAAVFGLTDATFAARFRWDGGSGWQRVFDFGNGTNQYLFFSPSSPGGKMRFAITLGSYMTEQTLEAPGAPVGEWTHVAVVLSGNTGTLHVNGVAVATGPISIDPAQVTGALNYLGKSQFPGDPYFNGSIDDFRIYDRVLGAAEVKALAVPPASTVVPRSYGFWAGGHAFEPGQAEPGIDADGDGLANLIEWLLDTNPLAGSGGGFLSARPLPEHGSRPARRQDLPRSQRPASQGAPRRHRDSRGRRDPRRTRFAGSRRPRGACRSTRR